MKNIFIPKSLWGKELPNERDKSADAKSQRNKLYLIESLLFGILMTSIEVVVFVWKKLINTINFTSNETTNIALTLILLYIFAVIIAYSFSYIIGELQIKKYYKKIDK